ncbi:MAG: 50S ribosomal protein L24 [Lentisphaeria bacterium]|nr:50S ribosomal protein L24 [Lentisphaeria bacterium]MBQ7394678.1 50S ribosomal protein L24 [Lentisphaeria bacterium]
MKRYHVKKGSKVFVNSGKWKGEVATIKAILTDKDRVVLEFADAKDRKIGRRTLKRSQANPNGGMVERSVSVHVSNVALFDESKADKKAEK